MPQALFKIRVISFIEDTALIKKTLKELFKFQISIADIFIKSK